MTLTNRFEEDPDFSIIVNKEVIGYVFNNDSYQINIGDILINPYNEDQSIEITGIDMENSVIHAKLG